MKYLFASLLVLFSIALHSQDKNELARPDIPGDLMVDVGFTLWSETSGELDQELWPSKSVGIYYLKSNKLNDKFRLNYGIGFSFDKVGFNTSTDSDGDPDQSDVLAIQLDSLGSARFSPVISNTERLTFNKYSIKSTYLDIPFEIRFYPQESEEGEGLFFSIGGILGARIKSKDKVVFEVNDNKYKSKSSGDFGMSNFRYGVQARFGFRGIHLFYKQYFSNVFREPMLVETFSNPEGQTFNPKLITFGINITGF